MNWALLSVSLILVALAVAAILVAWYLVGDGFEFDKSPQPSQEVKQLAANTNRDFTTEEIGAVGYFYKNPVPTERVLSSFRALYPRGDIAVLADGGDDFQRISDIVGAAYYEYSDNLSVKWSTPEKAFAWVERFNRGIQAIRQRWIIILEDDVLLRRRVAVQPLGQISGWRPYSMYKLSSPFSAWVRQERRMRAGRLPTAKDKGLKLLNRYGYNGCGGNLLDASFWRKHYNPRQVRTLIIEMFQHQPWISTNHPKLLHSDVMLSALVLIWGGSLLPLGDWTEGRYWDSQKDYAIVHDYKEDYAQEFKKGPHEAR